MTTTIAAGPDTDTEREREAREDLAASASVRDVLWRDVCRWLNGPDAYPDLLSFLGGVGHWRIKDVLDLLADLYPGGCAGFVAAWESGTVIERERVAL